MKQLYHLFLGLFVISTSILLTSCSSFSSATDQPAYTHASLAEGKANFKAKHYSLAYRQLLPLAVKGNAEAQYAVGYMYYYGKGIDRNEDLAESWLQKAASKGQSSAAAALKELAENRKNLAQQKIVEKEKKEEKEASKEVEEESE